MAKKSRRPNLPQSAFNAVSGNTKSAPKLAPIANSPTVQPKAVAVSKSASVNWQAEYGDVLADLKKTGVLALGLLVVMFILSLII
jgi:hypothetical protein